MGLRLSLQYEEKCWFDRKGIPSVLLNHCNTYLHNIFRLFFTSIWVGCQGRPYLSITDDSSVMSQYYHRHHHQHHHHHHHHHHQHHHQGHQHCLLPSCCVTDESALPSAVFIHCWPLSTSGLGPSHVFPDFSLIKSLFQVRSLYVSLSLSFSLLLFQKKPSTITISGIHSFPAGPSVGFLHPTFIITIIIVIVINIIIVIRRIHSKTIAPFSFWPVTGLIYFRLGFTSLASTLSLSFPLHSFKDSVWALVGHPGARRFSLFPPNGRHITFTTLVICNEGLLSNLHDHHHHQMMRTFPNDITNISQI